MRARARFEHRRAQVDADSSTGERREQLQRAPGAGAKIKQRLDGMIAEHVEDGGLDLRVRRMHGADAIPLAGLRGEIRRGLFTPRLAGDLQARSVGAQLRIIWGDAGDEVARQGPAGFGEPEKGPGALALPLGKARIDEKFQMAGDTRLRLA